MSLENHPNSAHDESVRPRQRISDRLGQGGILLLDGATGTELQRCNVAIALPLWSARALIEHPSAVQKIHREYVSAGADIVTANTFRTTARTFLRAGMSEADAARLTNTAVSLARAAAATAGRDVFVAGSVAPLEDCYTPELTPPFEVALAEHRAHADRLAKSGVDLILIETMPTAKEAEAAAIAALETGLDVVVSVVCGEDGRLLSGETLVELVRRVASRGVTALLVNCSRPAVITQCLVELASLTGLPVGGYANAGTVDPTTGWAPDPALTPRRYAEIVRDWVAHGARIVGGCCGTTPAHITAVRAMLDGLPEA